MKTANEAAMYIEEGEQYSEPRSGSRVRRGDSGTCIWVSPDTARSTLTFPSGTRTRAKARPLLQVYAAANHATDSQATACGNMAGPQLPSGAHLENSPRDLYDGPAGRR
jgi:hypothetical protein